jgi:hypothetical protein
MLSTILLAAALLPLAAPPQDAPPAPAKFAVDAASVERVAAVARTWVAEASGVPLAESVRARVATTEELQTLLAAENQPLFETHFGASEAATQGAQNFAASVAPAMLAKYVFGGSDVLVSAEGFGRLSLLLDMPELVSEEALRAVLVHEFAHAADERLYQWNDVLRSLKSAEQIEAFNAVLEGHAQLVTRRVCAAHGATAGFDVFNRAIAGERSTPAPDAIASNPVFETMEKFMKLRFSSWYFQGEKFMEALEKEGGADAVRLAFSKPPARMAVVYQPAWFLHPELEPKGGIDLDAVLDELALSFPKEAWRSVKNSLTPAQIELALSLASPEDRERLLAALRANRSLLVVPADGSGDRMIIVMLLEFSSPEEGAAYLGIARDISSRKDEAMKAGPMRVEKSEREELPPGARRGYLERKLLTAPGRKLPIASAVLTQETLAVELIFTNQEVPSAELTLLADQVFRSAALHRAK